MTRPAAFRFRSGEFVMIGLPNAEKPVFRAYSIASPTWDEELEFFSIKVPGGPLTEHLQKIKPGDTVLMKKKPTGTLVNDALIPGERLYLFSTGTGIAPFASLIRDPETYEKFGRSSSATPAGCSRAGLWLRDGREDARRSAGRRGGVGAADALRDDDARAERAHGADHRPDRLRQAVRGSRRAAARPRRRPRR